MKPLPMLLCAGILATVVGAFVAIKHGEYFVMSEELQAISGNISGEDQLKLTAARSDLLRKNTALVAGVFGAALCGLAGLATAVALRGRAVAGLLTGLVVGGGAGAGGGILNILVFNTMKDGGSDTFMSAIASHTSMWACIAAAFALAITIASRRNVLVQVGVAALLCAAISAALFQMLAAILLQTTNPELPRPEEASLNWLWFGLTSLLFTFGAGRTLSHTPSTDKAATAAPPPAAA